MSHDVFISYSSKDKVIADAVCARLEEKAVRCWIAPRDILPGRDWSESIIDAIHECKIMIVVFSSHSDASQQVRREAERAVSKGAIILPFRIEDVYPSGAMEYYLSTSHWLDALTIPLEEHLHRLADTVTHLLEVGETQTPEEAMRNEPHRPGEATRPSAGSIVTAATASGAAGAAGVGTAPAVSIIAPPSLPTECYAFNWGAFLLNRSWLGAHNSLLNGWGMLATIAPYFAVLVAVIFGFGSKLAWVLGLGVLVWVFIGVKANRWAWENRRWINADHFKKVQRVWLMRGVIFWGVILVAGTIFVKSGLNIQVRAASNTLLTEVGKYPAVATTLKQVNRVFAPFHDGMNS